MTAENLNFVNFARTMRERTVVLLKGMNTLAGPYVDASRAIPVEKDDAPRIIVFSNDRHFESIGDAPPQFDTTCKLTVVGYVTGAPVERVEDATELLGEQILQLMRNVAFTAPPVGRISAIDQKYEIKGTSDRYEGYTINVFDVKWTEVFEPLLAPFTGTGLPWAYGAPFQQADLTIVNAAGETLTGATISLSNTLSSQG